MTVQLSRRELVIVWNFLNIGQNWGGGEAAVLAQGELWNACRLGEGFTAIFDGNALDLAPLSEALDEYDLTPEAIALLRQILGIKQERLLGQLSYAALKRIKETLQTASLQ